jgi:hypothetical protein
MTFGLMVAFEVYVYSSAGGVFRKISRDVELHHPQISEDSVEESKRYEELLLNIEDNQYSDDLVSNHLRSKDVLVKRNEELLGKTERISR